MSVGVTIEFEGSALGERPSRDVAERILTAVRQELAKVGGSLDDGREEKVESRTFLGQLPFYAYGRKVTVRGGYHVDDEPAAAPATTGGDAPT